VLLTTSDKQRVAPQSALGDSAHLDIRRADPERDLEILVENLGQREFFADRLSRQKRNRGVLLTAWWKSRPIGDAYLWLEDAEEPELREHLPGVPLLTHVEILEDFRSLGIGTCLIMDGERELADLGHKQVALAVEMSNERAARLYARLGYQVWQHPSVPHVFCHDLFDGGIGSPETCQIMVKELAVG
jgi:GNAT superfamily N-acetyltransferase